MSEIDFAYWNFAHGGRANADASGDGGDFDLSPLVRVIGHEGRWPDVLIIGEADRYFYNGGEGAWGAVTAMADAGGRIYTPLECELPRKWGPFAPSVFVDQQALRVHRWYSHNAPDRAARRRNTLHAHLPGHNEDIFRVVTGHGDVSGGLQRLLDAIILTLDEEDDELAAAARLLVDKIDTWDGAPDERDELSPGMRGLIAALRAEPNFLGAVLRLLDSQALRHHARPTMPCLMAMDWNSTLSGPRWERQDLDDREGIYQDPAAAIGHVEWVPGQHNDGPRRQETWSLDYLCGRWNDETQTRGEGAGFYWVAELADDDTPTVTPAANGRQRAQIDGFVVNAAWKDRIVPDSFCVQAQLDPLHPDSDHLAVRVAIDV